MHPSDPLARRSRRAVAVFALVTALALAGCLHGDDDNGDDPGTPDDGDGGPTDPTDPGDPGDPDPPVQDPTNNTLVVLLQVSVDRVAGWAGEDNFTFDATNSTITNGNATRWVFDLGDGSEEVLEGDEEPIVRHSYAGGGIYLVNVTVEATGGQNGTEETEQTQTIGVSVQERHAIEGELATMIILQPDESEEHTFPGHAQAFAFNVSLAIEAAGGALADDAEGTVRVLDPDGEELEGLSFSVTAGENETVALDGLLNATGDHTVEVQLTAGEIAYTGEIWVLFPPAPGNE